MTNRASSPPDTDDTFPDDLAEVADLLGEHGVAMRAFGDYLRGRIGLGTLMSMPGVLAVLEPMIVAGERVG